MRRRDGFWWLAAAAEPLAGEATKDPQKVRKARALIPALAGIVIVGFALVGLAWWAARIARRRMGRRLGATRPIHDPWYQKPPPEDSSSDAPEARP
ncbi:MAG TPA: hypothetical protein VMF30_03425 [Pirellulales bacterium]|nr:hypothetical protein [Pirellulales bacterium]